MCMEIKLTGSGSRFGVRLLCLGTNFLVGNRFFVFGVIRSEEVGGFDDDTPTGSYGTSS